MFHHRSPGNRRGSVAAVALSATAVLALVTGCGAKKADTASDSTTAKTSGNKLFAQLPSAIQKVGVLNLGTDASAAPFASFASDNKTIVGVNADLAKAAGSLLGVRMNLQNVAFDQSIPSVTTHRLDMYWDWSKDRPESRAKVDFVDFATTGAGIVVPEKNPQKITKATDLCGKKVSVQDGSSNVDIVEEISKTQCVGAGKSAISVIKFDSVPLTLLQIKEGRAQAAVTAYGVAAYQGKISPYYDQAGPVISPLKAGVTVAKDSKQLRGAVQAALQELVDNGTYGKIMDRWGLDGAKIEKVTVNDGS